MNKKRIANEWLLFLGGILFGVVVWPLFMPTYFGGFTILDSMFISFLFGRHAAKAWLFVLAPYLIVQLIRSVIWAWKTSRN